MQNTKHIDTQSNTIPMVHIWFRILSTYNALSKTLLNLLITFISGYFRYFLFREIGTDFPRPRPC